MCQLNNFKSPWVNNQLWARMTQSDDKMGAHSTLQNIIPTERMGNIIEEEKHFTLYFWVNGFPAHRSVVFEEKRNCEVNGRALWCVCPWSTSVSWLQDSGGVSELKMDFSTLPRPIAGKKNWRPKLIGFVTDWGTAERWLQSDKTGSSLKFPKVMHMMLLTPGWRNTKAIRDPWTCSGLMMHQLLSWGPTPLANVSPALLPRTLHTESSLLNFVIFSVVALQSLQSLKGAVSTCSTVSLHILPTESHSTKKRIDVNQFML